MMNDFNMNDNLLPTYGDKNKVEPDFSEGIIEDGKLYAFDNRILSLCMIDLSDMDMCICARYELDIPVYVKRIFSFGDLMLMQLYQGSGILAYNRKTREFAHYDVEQPEEILYNFVPVGKSVYLIPLQWNDAILLFDVKSKKYEKIDFNEREIREGSIILRPFAKGKEIIFPTQTASIFYCLNLDTKNIEKRLLFEGDIVSYIASWDGKNLWFIEKKQNRLYCFDGLKIKVIEIPGGEYGNIVSLSEHVCVMPAKESNLLLISKRDGIVRIISTAPFEGRFQNVGRVPTGTRFVYCAEYKERIFFFPNDRRKMFMLNKSDYTTEIFACNCDEYKGIWRNILFGKDGIIHESTEVGPRELLGLL